MFAQLAHEFAESQRLLLFFHTKDRQKSKSMHKSAKKGLIKKIKKTSGGIPIRNLSANFCPNRLVRYREIFVTNERTESPQRHISHPPPSAYADGARPSAARGWDQQQIT